MENDTISPWIQCFKMLLDAPTPKQLEGQQDDNHLFWKLKGIAAKTTYFMFTKYSNPSLIHYEDEPKLKKFS